MKIITTIFCIFFIGMSAKAQNNTTVIKVKTIQMTIGTETAAELNLENTAEVVRLYKFKMLEHLKHYLLTQK